jgi:hypothetical protein
MSIGPDIKEAIWDVGTSYNILLPTPITDIEKLVYKGNAQATKPFIREFFLEATMSYDTQVIPGAVVKMVVSAIPYIVMNKTPNIFEDQIIENKVVLYKCNVSGELQRISGEVGWNPKYKKTPIFQTIRANAYGLQTEQLLGSGVLPDQEIGAISIDRQDLYIPTYYGVKELDRYIPVSGEVAYMVKAVKTRLYDNVDVCELIPDNR